MTLALIFSVSAFAQNENKPCPTIDVSGGGVISLDEPMSFSVKVSDEAKNLDLKYQWTTSQGKIIEGQGTPSIKIDITKLANINITATIEIEGLPENCANADSETGSVIICYRHRLFDEYEKLPYSHIQARISNLYAELGNNSTAQGYIINYGTDKEIATREKQIRKAITSLTLDSSQISIVNGGANPNGAGVWTKIRIVPPGADNPQP